MRSVHYFPRYSQPENAVTNNALLLLLRLHEFSRYKFENLIEAICDSADVQFSPEWLGFKQQVGTGVSVVDGFIAQDSVKIAVETKLHGSFSMDQLNRHLNLFSTEQHKLLIALSPSLDPGLTAIFASNQTNASKKGVEIVHTTFENLIGLAKSQLSQHDEEMLTLIEDFENFCSEMELLPSDEFTIFVPPCGKSQLDNETLRLYYCPENRTIRRARYLGIYAKKHVTAIGRIAKIATCIVNPKAHTVVETKNGVSLNASEKQRILEATIKAQDYGWNIESDHKFYLCDDWAPTAFEKTSNYGIQNRRYFDLRKELGPNPPKTLNEIAKALESRTWK
jgi:hypothetical protein